MRTIFLFLFCASIALGQSGLRNPSVVGNLRPLSTPVSYLIKQGFEGSGYDNGETWVAVTGSANPDDTTWPAASSSQNLALRRAGATVTVEKSWADPGGGTNRSIVSFAGAFVLESTNSNTPILNGISNSVVAGFLQVRAGGRLRLYNPNGTTFASPADPVTTNGQFWVWGDIDGTAGTVTLEWALTRNGKLGSGTKYATASGGATGGTIHGFQLTAANTGMTNYFDEFRAQTNPIPSNFE